MIPEEIQNKILSYNVHPVAEIIKQHLKYIQRGWIFFDVTYADLEPKFYHKFTDGETLFLERFEFRPYRYFCVSERMLKTIRNF